MSVKRTARRQLVLDDDDAEDMYYSFKVLLPNETSVNLELSNPGTEMRMESFVNLVKEAYDKSRKDALLMRKRTRVDWELGGKFIIESDNERIKGMVRFAAFKPNVCHIIRLDDGSGKTSTMYENLWDLTPDTDLLLERPENYTFETALADLIDNSLQAVWTPQGSRRMISVDVSGNRITVFDTGRGMDSSEENSIKKWGKIGASLHRSKKSSGIGGKPPYLKPFFGMYGYGGPYACMFLGSCTVVSSKTRESKKVFTLQFKKDALIENRSVSGKHWKTGGGMRDPSEEELKLSPHGSFTKVEIFGSKYDISNIYQLQCRLKDIYFPYIQCDELSKNGRTERPVEFQVNGEDLAEVTGGEVAITNLNSKGEEFWFQIRFTLPSLPGEKGPPKEANARLKFVYFPIVQGKESIEKILESLEEEGCKVSESFQSFGRVSVRRLGRLLPEARWDSIPFMKRGNIASTLQKSCQRVKCFIDLDAAFSPTPSKTDLASQNPFSVALRNFYSKSMEKEKDNDVKFGIHREGKSVGFTQLEQQYQDWVMKMHNTHDEEATSGEDEGVLIIGSLDKKALGILRDAVRVHKVVRRGGMKWKRGQKIKILKGACGGVHNNNVYATIDYFLIEGFEDEAGGDTRILCRPINFPENEGCTLLVMDDISSLQLQSSLSLPITIIDSGKCKHVDVEEWNKKLEQQQEKAPSKIDLLDERHCTELEIFDGELPVGNSVCVGRAIPQQIVAVVRPACFTSSIPSKKLDQRHIVKMSGKEMVMEVKFLATNMKSSEKNVKSIGSQSSFPTSLKGFSGLYIFSLESKYPDLFKKAGTYTFSFSIGDSIKCKERVVVRPSSKAAEWKLDDNLESLPYNVRVGSSLPSIRIACFDEYKNRVQFTSVPSLEIELEASPGFLVKIDKFEANLNDSGSVLRIKNMLVETDGLDQIRPNYEATLEIRAKDKPFSVTVACKVNPGPVERVAVNNTQALDNLLPGSTVEDFILEMFDGYNNHVAEGTDVLICVDGYSIEDRKGINRKVDGLGCIDLSGILKVTKGYGKFVSLSIISGSEEIFRKESQIEERELRLVTELPLCCEAGSSVKNLNFRVTDLDGSTDSSIHHDEKSGRFHTLCFESDSSNIQSEVRYAFVHGTCKVPTLSLPERDGVFSFKAFHSRYPELHVNLKIQLTPAPTYERDDIDIGFSTPYSKRTATPQSGMASTSKPGATPTPNTGLRQTPCSQFGVLSVALGSQTGPIDIGKYAESLKDKLGEYDHRKKEITEKLKCLEDEQKHIEETLQASLDAIAAAFPECLSTRDSMMKQIEENHHNTAASVFCSLYRNAPPPQCLFLSTRGVFGIVAPLGSVASTSLSRVLSVYLGKDTMLALVCKSSHFGLNSSEYKKIQSEADRLKRSINDPFLILSLDAPRPWSGGIVENDPQKKLAMDNPCMSNGDPIPGFKGYAVNMIDLGPEELGIQKTTGYSLRETLFYGLFGELQVYETGEHLQAALPYIDGVPAVSLDGLISKENGFVYSGSCKTEIHFPITVTTEKEEKELIKVEITRDRKRKAEKLMDEESASLRKIEKKLKKATDKYNYFAAMVNSEDT